MKSRHLQRIAQSLTVTTLFGAVAQAQPARANKRFEIVEATIADIHKVIRSKQLTATQLVNLYLARIKAYNGTCVNQPQGILGPVSPIANAGAINALMTLNLRPAARKKWGFDDRKARSMTDAVDNDPNMPDALEVAAKLDAHVRQDRPDWSDRCTASCLASRIVRHLRHAHHQRRGCRLCQRSSAARRDAREAAARGGRDHPREGQRRRIRAPAAAARSAAPCAIPTTPSGMSAAPAADPASSVAANLVTCAISEETAALDPHAVAIEQRRGLSPSQGLVSRDGHDRRRPAQRPQRRRSAARSKTRRRVLDVIAGYDPADELTVLQRRPHAPRAYASFAEQTRPQRAPDRRPARIHGQARCSPRPIDETIDIVDRAIDDLRKLGATIVDPGAEGALMQKCIDQHIPRNLNTLFIREFPTQFPTGADHVAALRDMYFDPSLVPAKATIRDFGTRAVNVGEAKYYFNRYLGSAATPISRT